MRNATKAPPLAACDKPKAILYRQATQDAETRIVEALPRIVDAMIKQAEAGDMGTARYLCDRVLGRAAAVAAPPAEDRSLPYTEEDAEEEARMKRLLSF